MKTKPMKHQHKGVQLLLDAAHSEYYGLGCEQGTGKTWMLLAEAEKRCAAGEIDALVVIAPNGVHTNWTRREAPTHLEIATDNLAWVSGPGVGQKREMERILNKNRVRGDLLLFSMNIDAVNTDSGYKYLRSILKAHRCMLAVDESTRIKSLKAGRTERMIELAPLAEIRRIASGTIMPNGPPDLFAQFEFLKPRGALLGTTSFRAFMTEFAVLVPEDGGVMRHIMTKKFGEQKMRELKADYEKLSEAMRKKISFAEYCKDRLGRRWHPPQIIQKDSIDGTPVWRNLSKLQKLIKPHLYRVLKKDCLDLPEKVFQVYSFKLPPKQRAVYDTIEKKLRYERDNGMIDSFSALTKTIKLRQAVSCFIMLDGEAQELIDAKHNPRLQLLAEVIEDIEGQFIIWAQFKEEIRQICTLLDQAGIAHVQYHGDIKKKDREVAVDSFQAGIARVFVGQPDSGGIGLTLTAAKTAIYYSRDFNAETRLQSQDRNHRIGSTGDKVLYIDIVAEDTIDERLILAVNKKVEVSARVVDDQLPLGTGMTPAELLSLL